MSGTTLPTAFQVQPSPSVTITETDLSQAIIQASTTQAALSGLFRWGPVNSMGVVSTPGALATLYAPPTNLNAETFFTGASYLAYSSSLLVNRVAANDVTSAIATTPGSTAVSNTSVSIYNSDDYIVKVSNTGYTANLNVLWVARYPGALGDSLQISICDSANAFSQDVYTAFTGAGGNTTGVSIPFVVGSNNVTIDFTSNTAANTFAGLFTVGDYLRVGNSSLGYQNIQVTNNSVITSNATASVLTLQLGSNYRLGANIAIVATDTQSGASYLTRFWQYFNTVQAAPNTTPYVAARGGKGDAMHVVVVDQAGLLTGNVNKVLETYQNLSRASDALNAVGGTNYYVQVINQQSSYIRWLNDRQASYTTTSNTATPLGLAPYTQRLSAGSDGASTEATVAPAVVSAGYQLFGNSEIIAPNLYLAGKPLGGTGNTQVINYIINNICSVRRDSIVTWSPDPSFVVNNKGSEALSIINNTVPNVSRSSYSFGDSGYKYMYDPYNNVYRYVPLNGDTAGLMAQTDGTKGVWWSPAGYNRGNIKNVVKLAYNPSKADRDLLYPLGINSVISTPGNGTLLLGDDTFLGDNGSVFNSVGVRRMFIAIEVALAAAAKAMLFEFNDVFTQQLFKNMVNPYLKQIQGMRGITNFKVICDSSNNTDQVISAKGFVGDIFIQPARSINDIQLNFFAIGGSAQFQEIVGSSS